eukprot:TRINITY_DN1582_c0_g1_i5.p1 TRINITY_DN1582_c0_g1~~TRINITY_DN1582_c0_g1_i5.p1  ORF type:complete len:318 (-),score=80.38 TRINITY_DN1582_c0_g1_i5:442-1395(-)
MQQPSCKCPDSKTKYSSHHISHGNLTVLTDRLVMPCMTLSEQVSEEEFDAFKDRLSVLGAGHVHYTMDDASGLARIELRNPDSRNALSGRMMVELADAVAAVERWHRGVALILTAEGDRAFCAGADLALALNHLTTPGDGRLMCALMTDTLHRLRALPLVSVAAVKGPAVGGGAELSTACDYRVMSSAAHIRFVQVKMGVSTGWGGAARLTRIVGSRQALRLLAWGEQLSASAAQQLGLVDLVTEEGEDAETSAKTFLEPLTTQPNWRAVRAVKAAVAAASAIPEENVLAERAAFISVWGGDHNRSVLEKGVKPASL